MSDVVVIKRYSMAAAAYIDAGLLRDNGVRCQVTGEDLINVMPLVGDQITLLVCADDGQRAAELLGVALRQS